jgi:pilus assembly protein Flp/PilA
MNWLRRQIIRFLRSEDGPTAVEYAIMAAAVIGVCVLAITQLGATTNTVFTNGATRITAS